MIKHYFKVAIRNCWKYMFFTIVNISGLAIGMAGAMMLLLWIENQYEIDSFHKNGKHIYKVYLNQKINEDIYSNPSIPEPLTLITKNGVPEIENLTRVLSQSKLLVYDHKEIQSEGAYVDKNFLQMFSFPFVEGKPFNDVKSILISAQLSQTLFNSNNPIGKTIGINNDYYTVTGVLNNMSDRTQLKFDFLLLWESLPGNPTTVEPWQNEVTAFVQLKTQASLDLVDKKLTDLLHRHHSKDSTSSVFLHPLEKIWLESQFKNGKPSGGLIGVVRILVMMSFIILLIASINFINLSTARSSKRAREVGVRKVMGVRRKSLILQFISESILLAFMAGIIAFIIVAIFLPSFNNLTEKNIEIHYTSIGFWLSFLGFILFTGVLSGTYPAFVLSSFNPVRVLKGMPQKKRNFISFRKVLVVSQFLFAIVLIDFTIMLKEQIGYMKSREPGFAKENLIFHTVTENIENNYSVLKNELSTSGAAIFVNVSNVPITRDAPIVNDIQWEGKSEIDKIEFEVRTSNEDFVSTNGVQLLEGRDINVEKFPGDTLSCLLNDVALKIVNFKNPIGQYIRQGNSSLQIVGIVKKFITGSPMQDVLPVIIRGQLKGQYLNIRLSSLSSPLRSQQQVIQIVKKYNPGFLTEFQYADLDYDLKMKGIILTANLVYIFAGIALFISCLGLFGLVIYVISNKIKEISIKKVFGASIFNITFILTRDFLQLVLISILISSPLSWLLMNSFLQSMSYRITPGFFILLKGGSIALLLTIITVTGHSVMAAIKNPIENLRNE